MESTNKDEPSTGKQNLINLIGKVQMINRIKRKLTTHIKNKEDPSEKDKKISTAINMILSEHIINNSQIINIPINPRHPFDGKIFTYALQKENKTDYDNYYLLHYLKFYDSFNNLLTKIYRVEERIFLFTQILNKINIEEKNENDILFKVGEYSERFYFLLYGSTTKLIPYQYDAIMDKHEYYIYMKYIYKMDEIELFNLMLVENEEIFDKFELLHFILGDKNLKFHPEAIKQLRNMECSYISERLFANQLKEQNFNNEKIIVLSQTKKTLDDVLKGDYIISCLDEKIRKINVSIEEYINNLKPINFEEENDDLVKKRVTLYSYKIDKELEVGEHLEELDENRINKKNSTIICNNHCILGYLLKKDYINSLKITQTKFHKNDITFLLGNEIFQSLNFSEFDRSYFRLFELMKKYQNQMLFEQGEANDNIYFIKQGEASVNLEGNINDLYRIIGLKGGPKNRKMLDINYIKRFYSINIEEKFFSENKNFALFKINENFPLGMEDFIDEENECKQLFNVYCNMDSEVLRINKDDLNEISYREREVYRTKDKYIIKRKQLLIDKLNTLKNGLIQKYIYEKFKRKIFLPDLFDESALSPKNNKNIDRNFIFSPKRKNDLLYIDTKFNGKTYREITSALKLKAKQDLEQINNEQNENQKKNNNEEYKKDNNKENSNKKNDDNNDDNNNSNEINNNAINDDEKNIYEEIKTENNIIINNLSKNIINEKNSNSGKKPKRRKSVLKISNPQKNKYNKELLDLIKTPYTNPLIRLQKNKKAAFDPLDKLYKELKFPSFSNSKSIKNLPTLNLNRNSIIYEIKSFKLLTPVKPHKFIPNKRKIILPQKEIGYFNKKMKEIKVFKNISQDKSSVILKTEISPHDLYFDRNNILISTINFNKNKKGKSIDDKKSLIFNNIKINQSINYKINKSNDKINSGTNTLENEKIIGDNKKLIIFPKIINNSMIVNKHNY